MVSDQTLNTASEGRARHRLVHQLRKPQRPRAGGNPFAALQFHWVELERVVRIEGRVEQVSAEESDAYYPPARSTHAWALGLTAKPGDRLARGAGGRRRQVRRAVTLHPPRPPHWGGYRLEPDAGSSGRAARAACTTGCATGCTKAPGCASAWPPDHAGARTRPQASECGCQNLARCGRSRRAWLSALTC